MPLRDLIAARIRARGPITVAEFMDLALYHPQSGYYATAPQRSGQAGDFFTSVDVGSIFGELLAVQFAEMWRLAGSPARCDLVEAAASNGRLARDVLDGAQADDPDFYAAIALHLVETSAAARGAQRETLGPHAAKLASGGDSLPTGITGVIFANELLDALPVHLVVMREDGLKEVHVGERNGELVAVEGPPSTPEIAAYLARAGATLGPGCLAEVNLAAEAWVARAARSLAKGFLVIIDYGRDATELYSGAHANGTLRSFRHHATDPAPAGWLADPGERDITAHVDLTGVRLAAERESLVTLAALDQTYLLLGLGLADRLSRGTGDPVADLKRRLAAKTLLVPGGMGSTHKVLVFGKHVGTPRLTCTSFKVRLT
jgi:SAM-dependent MidA family methyltransferase